VVFVRNSLLTYVKRINKTCKFAVFLVLRNTCTGYDNDILLTCAYLPPKGSSFYCQFNNENGVELLQEEILSLSVDNNYDHVICGDLNSRCGGLHDYIVQDGIDYVDLNSEWYNTDNFDVDRKCKDKEHNIFGKSLVDFCVINNVHMLNGRVGQDLEGGFTCVMPNGGKSTIDYCLCSTSLFKMVKDFCILYKDITLRGMSHFPVIVTLNCTSELNNNNNESEGHVLESEAGENYERIKWNTALEQVFVENIMNARSSITKWDYIDSLLENGNVAEVIKSIETLYKEAACDMIVKPRSDKSRKKNGVPWWDSDLQALKKERNAKLRLYRQTRNECDLTEYMNVKRMFKKVFREKENIYKKNLYTQLKTSKHNSAEFWKFVQQLDGKNNANKCNITEERWVQYYKTLLNQDVHSNQEFVDNCDKQLCEHDDSCRYCNHDSEHYDDTCELLAKLNEPITVQEVKNVITHMKRGKAPGCDGLIIELFQKSLETVSPRLCNLYNKIFESSDFPEEWSKAIVCSLHKGGNVNCESNYRGISLLSICGKVFTKILNNRLVSWAKLTGHFYEEQAGYREGYSTTDHIFSLYSLAEKYLSKPNGRCYVLFVDLSKAFDKIPHGLLWHRLLKIGLHGNVIKVIRSMYSQLKSCVRIENSNRLTEWFECHMGTRQGCMLSPFLFTMYLNELIENITDGNVRGIYVSEEFPNVCMLCYADDMANCADVVSQLQHQINTLEEYCDKYGMMVNLAKTKVVVFRNGGPLRKNEKWFYKGETIECVSVYKYLGLLLSSTLKWHRALKQLGQQAQKALYKIYKVDNKCGGIPHSVYFELFDKMVVPILCYGAEIWGYSSSEHIESVQRAFCRRVLGVKRNTSNSFVLGDCGRYPLMLTYFKKCVCYWLKLLEMPGSRLAKQCYLQSKKLFEAGRDTWAGRVKYLLDKYGLGYVWYEGVQNKEMFISEFVQRIKDCYQQEWHYSVMQSGSLKLYKVLIMPMTYYEPAPYVLHLQNKRFISAVARFRSCSHSLNVEKAKYVKPDKQEDVSICQFCLLHGVKVVENEYHVMGKCTTYIDLRCRYLDCDTLTETEFINVMMSKNEKVMLSVALFVLNACKLRETLLCDSSD